MSYFDFDQEATVTWSDKPIFGDVHGGPGNVRPFPTLRETAFVMTVTTNITGRRSASCSRR